MKLNISDRIALLGVFPQQGNIVTLRIVRELQTQLSFTEEEIKLYGIENHQLPDGRANITWNPEFKDETKDIKIGEAARNVIAQQLKRLDSQNQLHISMLPIYDKFAEQPTKP